MPSLENGMGVHLISFKTLSRTEKQFSRKQFFCSIARGLHGRLLDISIDLIQVISGTVVESRIWK